MTRLPPAVFDRQRQGHSTFVSEIPGRPGDLLIVTRLGLDRWLPEGRGPARLRGAICPDRATAQAWAEKRVRK
jgi:hypothetical protein